MLTGSSKLIRKLLICSLGFSLLVNLQSCISSSSDNATAVATDTSDDTSSESSSNSDDNSSDDSSSESVTVSLNTISALSVNEFTNYSSLFDASGESGDTDSAGGALTYSCVYDTTIDGAVDSGTSCTSLNQFSFNTSTGAASWLPSFDAYDDGSSGQYEFKVTGTSSGVSDSEVFTMTVTNVNAGLAIQHGNTTSAPGGDVSLSDECVGLVTDDDNNLYCCGYTTGDFGEAHSGVASRNLFGAKWNSSGAIQWVTQLGSSTTLAGVDNTAENYGGEDTVALDSSGNLICGGQTSGSFAETNAGGNDVWVALFQSDGTLSWVKQMGTTTTETGGDNASQDYINGIATDSEDNIYLAGYTSGDVGEANGGSNDVIVVKYNTSGVFQWAKQFGSSTSAGGNNTGSDEAMNIAVDSNDNIFVVGRTAGSFIETNGGGGGRDAFVLKLSSSGALVWGRQLGSTTVDAYGTSASGYDDAYGIGVDSDGNILIGGYTDGNLGETNGGSDDIFFAQLDSSGSLNWIRQLGQDSDPPGADSSGGEYCYNLAVDSKRISGLRR